MALELLTTDEKPTVFDKVSAYLGGLGLEVASIDAGRPWGGFFVIDEAHTNIFIQQYFPDLPRESIEKSGRLSPKLLVVAPDKRLSWQYHFRRAELWRVVTGPVGVITGETDVQGPVQAVESGETVQFETEVRHRLIGLDNWGIVAEIWQHTDAANLSDESDIVRVEDDFGR